MGHFKFAWLGSRAADALLDDKFAVEAGCQIHRGGQFGALPHLADSDRGTEVCGFDEDRVGQGFLDEAPATFRVGPPFCAPQGDVRRLRQARGGEQLLHHIFVHAGGGAKYARADVRQVSDFQQALDGAVFPERPMQDREDAVDGPGKGGRGLHNVGALGRGLDLQRLTRRRACEQRLGRVAAEPVALLGDTDRHHFELAWIDGFEDGSGGKQ